MAAEIRFSAAMLFYLQLVKYFRMNIGRKDEQAKVPKRGLKRRGWQRQTP